MAGLPTVQVLLDDGTGTFPYDITSKCRIGYGLTRGRQDERSDVTPGVLQTLVLDNTDGRFTLGSTVIASPSPIRVDNRIRVKVTANAVTRNRFTGYVQEWPNEWPTGGDTLAEVTVMATDVQARAERRELLSIIQEEIMADGPLAYYIFGEPSGAAAAGDQSGNQQGALGISGSGADLTFGEATGPSTDGETAVQFAGGKYLADLGALAGLSAPYTLEVFFNVPTAAADGKVLATLGANASRRTELVINIDGTVVATNYRNDGTTLDSYNGGGDYTNTSTHHVGFIRNSTGLTTNLLLDGVSVISGAAPASTIDPITDIWAGGYQGSNQITGVEAHLAVFASALAAARVTAHAQAGLTGFAGESGTARLTRIAGYAGVPVGTLDPSLTNVAFTDIAGTSAAQQLRAVADAEVGIVFIDGSGNLTFHNRNRATVKTAPDITLTADQISPATVVPVDMQGVVNYITTSAVGTGVQQLARNTLSEQGNGTVTNPGHGRYPDSKEYLVLTDAEALDRANWLVNMYGEPTPRVPQLTVDLLPLDAATQSALLGAEANTWIRVTGLPSQTPGGTTLDVIVQGFTETMTADSWQISFNVVAKAFFTAWILGDSTYGVLGSTTRLGI